MCSGCSGDYAGGFESDDSEEPASDSGAAISPPVGGLKGFEADTDTGAGPNSESNVGSKTEGGEICDILVSGTRIIEIRTVLASSCCANELQEGRASEMAAARKHSSMTSAKHYQTREGGAKISTNRMQISGVPRVTGSAGDVCTNKAKKWFEWGRRAIGKLSAGDSRAS
jgi:hypothetical protein